MSRRCSLPAINKLSQQRVCFSSWTKGKKNYRAIKKMERSACRWRTWRTSLALLPLPPARILTLMGDIWQTAAILRWRGGRFTHSRSCFAIFMDSIVRIFLLYSLRTRVTVLLNHRIKLNPLTRFILLIHLHGMH